MLEKAEGEGLNILLLASDPPLRNTKAIPSASGNP